MNYEANGKLYKFVQQGEDELTCSLCTLNSNDHTEQCREAPCSGGYFMGNGTRPTVVGEPELQAVCRRALLNIYGDTWREDMSKLLDKIEGVTR